MFAGRYLWWMLIALAVFLFFAMSFDYVTWATVATSSCARVAGSCGPLILMMTGTIKPIGYYIAGGIILVVTFARIHHIGMSWLWCLFVLVLFGASAPFPLLLANVWTGQMNSEMVMENLPVAFPFLVVFCIYIGWSFEEAAIKRHIAGCAIETYVLLTADKLDRASACQVLPVAAVSGLIVPDDIEEAQLAPYRSLNGAILSA